MLLAAVPSTSYVFGTAVPLEQRAAFCADPPWWTAPVIVGGSGGSGTRGSVLLLSQLGVAMACETADLFVDVGVAAGVFR